MQFAHGLDLKRENVNKILEIAQKKGYLVDINFELMILDLIKRKEYLN